jgi:hypothetical protein
MLRVMYQDSAGESLGFVVMRWADRQFFDPGDGSWKATPTAKPLPLAPVQGSGQWSQFYAGQVDSAGWPDGLYVAFILDAQGVIRRNGYVQATLHNGDDAPVFPPAAFSLAFPALTIPVTTR